MAIQRRMFWPNQNWPDTGKYVTAVTPAVLPPPTMNYESLGPAAVVSSGGGTGGGTTGGSTGGGTVGGTVGGGIFALMFYSPTYGQAADYVRYLYDAPQKTDRMNDSTLFDFTLAPYDSAYDTIRLKRGHYVKFYTKTYGLWFTGFITNNPEPQFVGKDTKTGEPIWVLKYEAASDDVLLNQKPVGIVPPFLNTTHGEIIKTLAALLAPNVFDTSNVQDGLQIARYVVDPSKKFLEIVQDLAKQANFTLRAQDKKLYYVPVDAPAGFIVDRNDQNFTPSSLDVKPSTDPLVNDAVVIGDVEPQDYMNEYFVGDGSTGNFPMISAVFGSDSALLLDDAFSGGAFDESKWTVYDSINSWLQVANGFVNALGGNQNQSYDVYISSAQLLPLEGNLRITHGEFDFIDTATTGINGIIGSLWTQPPNWSRNGCIFGVEVEKLSDGTTTLKPVVNGQIDPTTTPLTLNMNHRYIIRTLLNFQEVHRMLQGFSYVNNDGSVTKLGGTGSSDYAVFSTIITELDPVTGTVSGTTSWRNVDVALSANSLYANYCPLILNDLHCTYTNVTISVPLQAFLEVRKKGASAFDTKIVGPNELDSYDGMAPVATIQTTNQSGMVQRNSLLGTPKFNPGNTALTFFKDSSTFTGFVPNPGDLIHLRYRQAGASVARVTDMASQAMEAAAWGDNGLRSVTHAGDLDPSPRNSQECEMAAAVIVGNGAYQHYSGTYKLFSFMVATEPLSGTSLSFRNLSTSTFQDPVQLPISASTVTDPTTGLTVQSPGDPNTYNFTEIIQEVVSSLSLSIDGEYFEHSVTFGNPDLVQRQLQKFRKQADVFTPQDTAEIPLAIDPSVIGQTDVGNVTAPFLSSWDVAQFVFDAGQDAPSDGGFEVRYSDEGWSVDDGKNLVLRFGPGVTSGPGAGYGGRTWMVPRSTRGRVCFIKAFDGRNKCLWSEDFTQPVWVTSSGAARPILVSLPNIEGDIALVGQAVLPANGSVSQTVTSVKSAATQMVFTIDLQGPAGVTAQVQIKDSVGGVVFATTSVSCTGAWQRVYCSGTGDPTRDTGNPVVSVQNTSGLTQALDLSRASLETNQQQETVYCKTKEAAHGAYSRYAAGLRVRFPGKPPVPAGTMDLTSVTEPVVQIILPNIMQDIWGVEIRDSDNSTVLYKDDLSDAAFAIAVPTQLGDTSSNTFNGPMFQVKGNESRTPSYWLYTYNLLGEYSDPFNLTGTIPSPSVASLRVDDSDKKVKWDSTGAKGALVEVCTDPGLTQVVTAKTTPDQFYQLADTDFFPQRYIKVTPYDDLGDGIVSNLSHVYTPAGLVEMNGNEVTLVTAPPTPVTDPTPPTGFSYPELFTDLAWRDFSRNRFR